MDYNHFLDEFDTYNEWNQLKKRKDDTISFTKFVQDFDGPHNINDRWRKIDELPEKDDRVNSPSHYTSGKTEVIDIIEDAIQNAPTTVQGMLQGQVLKYMLRCWLKDNPLEDRQKAHWYLTRLIAPTNNV